MKCNSGRINPKKNGFSIIEMMIFICIFSIVAVTFYRTFSFGTKTIIAVKNRLGATALANEKMEIIRNLDYPDIGTIGGIPDGKIIQDETVDRSGKTYYVKTFIRYIDDPTDGTAPNDTDYKEVRVQAYWVENDPLSSVTLVSTFVPPGLEQIYAGGILSLHVLDNSGNGIPQADVNIVNDGVVPKINVLTKTDNDGNVFLPGAKSSDQGYAISISKEGYVSAQTYPPYPKSLSYPVDVHASVTDGSINEKTVVTDLISTIHLRVQTPLGIDVPNLDFGLSGGRKLFDTVEVPSSPIYAFDEQNLKFNADAEITLSAMSSGNYSIAFPDTLDNEKYVFFHIIPGIAKDRFFVDPGINAEETIFVLDKTIPSLLVTTVDKNDSTPIKNATVRLRSEDSSYDLTMATDLFGQVFFPDVAMPLISGTYRLSVSASGYESQQDATISINNLTFQEIKLEID